MKKILLTLICLCQISACFAANYLKVTAMEDFSTDSPKKTFNVRLREEGTLGKYELPTNSILHCQVLQVVDPKRGKRNAVFFVKPLTYTQGNQTLKIQEEMYGKYTTVVLSKEEIKKLPYGKMIKNGALMVGSYFVKGLSIGVAFVEGVAKNEQDNRLKSGVTNAYEESPISLVEKGEQLDIKTGDDFYFVFKTEEDVQEPNYTYTPAEEN